MMSKRPESTVGAAARMEFASYKRGLNYFHTAATVKDVKLPEIEERQTICNYIQSAQGSDRDLLDKILLAHPGKCIDCIWGWIKKQGKPINEETIGTALKALV